MSTPKAEFLTSTDQQIDKLLSCKMLTEAELICLIEKAKEILKMEPNCIKIKAPVTICGDTHGQFYDLMELFKMGG